MATSPAAVLWHACVSPNLPVPQVLPSLKPSCATHLLHHERCAGRLNSFCIKPGHAAQASAS